MCIGSISLLYWLLSVELFHPIKFASRPLELLIYFAPTNKYADTSKENKHNLLTYENRNGERNAM